MNRAGCFVLVLVACFSVLAPTLPAAAWSSLGLSRASLFEPSHNSAGAEASDTFNFSVSVSPSSNSVAQGKTIYYTTRVTLVSGTPQPVGLSLQGLPSNVGTWGFSPSSDTPTFTSTLTIVTFAAALPDTYPLTIIAQGGGLTRTVSITLTVNPSFDFSVSVTPTVAEVTGGRTMDYEIRVALVSGSPQFVSLSLLGLTPTAGEPNLLPSNVGLWGFSPSSGRTTFNSTLTLSTFGAAPSGTYPLTIVAEGGGVTRTASITLKVNSSFDFSISATPTVAEVTGGQRMDYDIPVALVGSLPLPVSLGLEGLPPDVGAWGFSPSSASTSFTSKLTIGTLNTAPPGTYPLTAVGKGGGLTRAVSITLKVNSESFDWQFDPPNPPSVAVEAGTSITYSLTARQVKGSPQTVSLSLSGLPGNVGGYSFSPPSGSPPFTSTLTVTTLSWASAGTHTLRINGSGGGLDRSILVALTLNQAETSMSTAAIPDSSSGRRGAITFLGELRREVKAYSTDGKLAVTIPAGTLAKDERGEPLPFIRIAVDESPPRPPGGTSLIGSAYQLEPGGAIFKPPVTLNWKYDPGTLPKGANETDLFIASWDEDGGRWVVLEGLTVDAKAHAISVPVSHFTTFALFGYQPATREPEVTVTPVPRTSLPPKSNWLILIGVSVAMLVAAVTIWSLGRRKPH